MGHCVRALIGCGTLGPIVAQAGCASFTLPAAFTFGNAPRNGVQAPGYADIDASIQKTIAMSRARLQLRWDVFNLLNRANFNVPNRIAFTPNFGRIFSASAARQMQFGAKVVF